MAAFWENIEEGKAALQAHGNGAEQFDDWWFGIFVACEKEDNNSYLLVIGLKCWLWLVICVFLLNGSLAEKTFCLIALWCVDKTNQNQFF
jgi:hypothetical protein